MKMLKGSSREFATTHTIDLNHHDSYQPRRQKVKRRKEEKSESELMEFEWLNQKWNCMKWEATIYHFSYFYSSLHLHDDYDPH